eukprot:CAMPEP_0178387892 /NCGR_PEP_ID=MMETSP0689_2-20121128/9312_1 /TAXON_ID=160604 /ORGANISM="Amphidinium massartii, Strain CS-259" /LENGTH=360 /DNA_ID=CAMNT_0020008279 /DNA_START=62 /DNA_END=1141 /DNA_ORIENTATION=-
MKPRQWFCLSLGLLAVPSAADGNEEKLDECAKTIASTDFRIGGEHFTEHHLATYWDCVNLWRTQTHVQKAITASGLHHPVLIVTGHTFPSVALPRTYNPCWEDGFNYELCCEGKVRDSLPAGAVNCWQGHMTYDYCCKGQPSEQEQVRRGPLADTPHNFVVPALDLNVGNNIKRYGTFTPRQNYELQRLISPGGIAIDAGANLGAYTVGLAGRVGPTGKVHSFEAFRHTFQHLTANVALNGLTNVYTYNVALGRNFSNVFAHGPDLNLPTVPASVQVLNQMSTEEAEKISMRYARGKESVRIIPLDSMGFKHVDLIKIDVEDMEVEVVLGARKTLQRCRPIVWAEAVNHWKADDRSFTQL